MNRIMNRWTAGVAVILVAAGLMAAAGPSAASMATAASKFVESLTAEQRKRATFAFDSNERMRWHFIPTETFPRKGLTIKEMTPTQRELAHGLMKAGLSQRGYLSATEIMALESILSEIEGGGRGFGGGLARDSERYFFSVFGTPSVQNTWGWRVEGHHLSLHFTLVNGTLIASSPSFMGANPAEVRDGPKKGMRILAAEEDAARALIESLTESQRQAAIISAAAPNDIVTMASVKVDPLSPVGIAAAALTPAQRDLLRKLVDVYAGKMAEDIAADRRARIESAGWDKVTFAWAGTLNRGARHYYRVQGPTFLIEYDNTQNNANHIHSTWRDFNGDFGADLLREHVRRIPH